MTVIQTIAPQPAKEDVDLFSEMPDLLGVPVAAHRARPTPRKLRVIGRDASVRMEQHLWDDYEHICASIGASPNDLARRIEARTAGIFGLTSAMSEFILRYWRSMVEMPHVQPDARIRAILWGMGPAPQGQLEGLVLRAKDSIAPHLTPSRARTIAELPRTDLAAFAAQVREQWGAAAPWEPGQDYIAGRALDDMIPVAKARARAA
jgi:hypothetical protein